MRVDRHCLAAVALLPCVHLLSPALADPPPNGAPASGTPATVTIEAQRQREQLRREVNRFVQATIVRPRTDESLLRWDSPVCPLVAGLTHEQGEFVLARFSAIARAANAPLAVRQAKKSIHAGLDLDLKNGLLFEIEAYNRLVPTADRHEGVRAFNEKRKPRFEGR